MKNRVIVIGGGLAGCEASYQLAKRGIDVVLYEMKPLKKSPAHNSNDLCELVCSNSLKSQDLTTAAGLLKEELKTLDSLVLRCAFETRVDAGGALAVDRDSFSRLVTEKIKGYKNITIKNEEITDIPKDEIVIIATGPLTSPKLSQELCNFLKNDYLYFYDACAPIINYDTIDMSRAFFADRYGKGNNDYINCAFTKEEYQIFWKELVSAERVPLKSFENLKVFEGCMPVEVMASRGEDTLRFGPLKPVGITNPHSEQRPYAVVQLRKEDNYNKLFNMVGFQTNLTFAEQKRVFQKIPGLENAEFVRYGVMHRNTFVNAPAVLSPTFQTKICPNVFLAGQLSGVEGYLESVASGLLAGINAYNLAKDKELIQLSDKTAFGALVNYICNANEKKFQPMHVNYGILPPLESKIRDEKERKLAMAKRSIETLKEI